MKNFIKNPSPMTSLAISMAVPPPIAYPRPNMAPPTTAIKVVAACPVGVAEARVRTRTGRCAGGEGGRGSDVTHQDEHADAQGPLRELRLREVRQRRRVRQDPGTETASAALPARPSRADRPYHLGYSDLGSATASAPP